jgi:hypothetical protein
MKILRFIKNIESDQIVINNLKKFKGQQVKILIFPYQNQNGFTKENSSKSLINKLYGSCKSFADGMEFQNKFRTEWER